ncbi:MAG: Bax inhibitor-1/YccA family protein [Bacteroidales bacterium]|nr:Bax inhibitor-1/YccA family protein [Bacteroidales bacterium]
MAEATISETLSGRKQLRLRSGEADRMSTRAYNLTLTGLLAYGLLLNAVIVYYFSYPLLEALQGVNTWLLLVGYMAPTLLGIFLAAKSQNPKVSFLGYNLVVLPLGVVLSLIASAVSVDVMVKAIALTGMVTLTMMLLALLRPQVFLGLGRTLFIALAVGIVAELVATFLMGYDGGLFDWFFVLLFSGYIGYDVAKSQAYPKTLDNAVDSALDIYLDIIVLFIRLLNVLGRKD